MNVSIRFRSLRSLTLVCGGLGIVLGASAQEVYRAATTPQGVIAHDLGVGLHGASFPLIDERFVGTVEFHHGSQLVLANAPDGLTNLLDAGERYFVEALSGSWEGERFDLALGPTLAAAEAGELWLDLGPSSLSTRRQLPDGALVGAQVAVRRHLTLATLPQQFASGWVGHDNAHLADRVHLHGRMGFSPFHLQGDGAGWREAGRPQEQSDRVLPPDESFLLDVRNGEVRWRQTGTVRTNAFRANLRPRLNAFATGFPVDLSPADIGARTDPQVSPSQRWTGNNNHLAADRLSVREVGANAWASFYLRGDGESWWPVGGSADFAEVELIPGVGATLLQRMRPDNDFIVLPPF